MNQEAKRIEITSTDDEKPQNAVDASDEIMEFNQRLNNISPSTPITYFLVTLNIGIFVLMALNGYGLLNVNPAIAVDWGANFGPMTLNGEWWRLLTSTFIHFGLVHIAFNMYVLFTSGRMIERIFGSSHFLLLYLFSGLTGSMTSLLFNPYVNSAGASGAIFWHIRRYIGVCAEQKKCCTSGRYAGTQQEYGNLHCL